MSWCIEKEVTFVVPVRFLCGAIQTSTHIIFSPNQCCSLLRKLFPLQCLCSNNTLHLWLILYEVTRVKWFDCNDSSCQSVFIHIISHVCFFFLFLALKDLVCFDFLVMCHLSITGISMTCFTSVYWQVSFFRHFFVVQISHSLMLSFNFTLHSCSYRRPSICN